MKKLLSRILACTLALCLLTACTNKTSATTSDTLDNATQTTAADSDSLSFSDLSQLLGKSDADVTQLLGEGQENFSADGSFFIGRIYQPTVHDTKLQMYTICADDEAHTVDSLSLWITDGSTPVSDDTVSSWVDALTQHIGADPTITELSEESGTRTWRWTTDETIWSQQLLENILTLSVQPQLGGESR